MRRLPLIVLAVVLLAAGFVLARGLGTDEGNTADTPTTTTSGAQPGASPAASREAEPQAAPQPAPARVERIQVRDGAPVGEPPTLEFDKGDTVRLRFSSNAAGEVHIHGYDRYVQLAADEPATVRFRATIDGIFEVESHDTAELLARLEISP